MARHILENRTIIDYINISIEYNHLLERNRLKGISLNREEWVQLMNLIDDDYMEAATRFTKDPNNPHQVSYEGIMIFYDGMEETRDAVYQHFIDEYKDQIDRHRARVAAGEQTTTAATVAHVGPATGRGAIPMNPTEFIRHYNTVRPIRFDEIDEARPTDGRRITF